MKFQMLLNGSMSIILTPESDIEKEVVKQMNGGTATIVTGGNSILQNNIEGSLIITKQKNNDQR